MPTLNSFLDVAMPFFPLVFGGMWLLVASRLSKLAGWPELSAKYPNRFDEHALASFSFQVGRMRTVTLQGVLKVAVCESGLRVGIVRAFAPFDKPFFVPWQELNVSIEAAGLLPITLTFGNPAIGALCITSELAQELQSVAGTRWPNAATIASELAAKPKTALLRQWLTITSLAAAFFYLAPRLLAPAKEAPSLLFAVLFPAIFFGIGLRLRHWMARARR
jgi:hypothetical protein